MSIAYPLQKIQDWLTQQWNIIWGRKIDPKDYPWLMGPIGGLVGIGELFIQQLAEEENLQIEKGQPSKGLLHTIGQLNLSDAELTRLSKQVIEFYEKTSDYNFHFTVKWNPFFKLFGGLVNKLFSSRINQLNIPTKNVESKSLTSEIITLVEPISNDIKRRIWLRKGRTNGQVIYSGVYETCVLPSGKTCVKAIFPLPNGNATVIMHPIVNQHGRLVLDSSGNEFGEAGFYFLLKDSKEGYWAQYIRSFRDQLTIGTENEQLIAEQSLTLWGQGVVKFIYAMERRDKTSD